MKLLRKSLWNKLIHSGLFPSRRGIRGWQGGGGGGNCFGRGKNCVGFPPPHPIMVKILAKNVSVGKKNVSESTPSPRWATFSGLVQCSARNFAILPPPPPPLSEHPGAAPVPKYHWARVCGSVCHSKIKLSLVGQFHHWNIKDSSSRIIFFR